MFSEVIYLISKTETRDSNKVLQISESKVKCYATKQNVSTKEFYSAVGVGLRPSAEFVIKRFNYSGENEIEWNEERYSVIRMIEKNIYDLVLVVEKKVGAD